MRGLERQREVIIACVGRRMPFLCRVSGTGGNCLQVAQFDDRWLVERCYHYEPPKMGVPARVPGLVRL
jgi:hypothetical protein